MKNFYSLGKSIFMNNNILLLHKWNNSFFSNNIVILLFDSDIEKYNQVKIQSVFLTVNVPTLMHFSLQGLEAAGRGDPERLREEGLPRLSFCPGHAGCQAHTRTRQTILCKLTRLHMYSCLCEKNMYILHYLILLASQQQIARIKVVQF